jgi:flagellar hook assembly protein FlgD
VLGKKVATVFNGSAKPGTYKVTWNGKDINGRNLPSGLYIYELDAGIHFKQTKKMTLIK